jgi:hypothetical protein
MITSTWPIRTCGANGATGRNASLVRSRLDAQPMNRASYSRAQVDRSRLSPRADAARAGDACSRRMGTSFRRSTGAAWSNSTTAGSCGAFATDARDCPRPGPFLRSRRCSAPARSRSREEISGVRSACRERSLLRMARSVLSTSDSEAGGGSSDALFNGGWPTATSPVGETSGMVISEAIDRGRTGVLATSAGIRALAEIAG